MPKLSQKFAASLGSTNRDAWFWDDTLKGFAIRQRPNKPPQWYVRYTVSRKKFKHRIGPCDVIKAEAARERAREIIAAGRVGIDHNAAVRAQQAAPTMRDLAEAHQAFIEPSIAPKTHRDRWTHWRRHILPVLGDIKVSELARGDVVSFHNKLKKKQPHLANRTLATISKALNDSTTWRPAWRTDNPAARIAKPDEPHRQTIFARRELEKVFEKLEWYVAHPPVWIGAVFLFQALMISGLRLAELSKRTWDEIDLSNGTLTIPKPKGRKKARVVTLSSGMIDLLRALKARRSNSPYVFPNSRGGCFTFPQKHWTTVCSAAGVTRIRIHDIRHTVASYAMHDGGLSQREVMELLGQSQMSTTARYLNLHDEMKRSIADRAAGAMRKVA